MFGLSKLIFIGIDLSPPIDDAKAILIGKRLEKTGFVMDERVGKALTVGLVALSAYVIYSIGQDVRREFYLKNNATQTLQQDEKTSTQ